MITQYNQSIDDRFNRFLIKALFVHFGIVIIAVVFQKILGLDFLSSKVNPADVKIIQSSVRVDVVSMPKFTVQELKKMKIAPTPTEEVKEEVKEVQPEVTETKDELSFKEKSKKKINLQNLLSNIGKPKARGKKKKQEKVNALETHRKELRNLVLEGNKVSAGTSVVGDGLLVDKTKFNTYVARLANFVRPHWKLPSYLMDRDLKCRIKIFIAANGKILRSEIYESSGVDEFDRKAISALNQVSTLPPPESEILARVTSGQVVLGFPL